MHLNGQNQNKEFTIEDFNFTNGEPVLCMQIRDHLDALFGGYQQLENMTAAAKRNMLAHLAACRDCCRSFDVRVRFRPAGRGIF